MADYIQSPIETDPDLLFEDAVDFLQTRWPNWVPNEGNLETWVIGAMTRMNAETRDVASDVPPAIYRAFGQKIFGEQPVEPTPSSVGSTWSISDNPDGRTIVAGTLIGIEDRDQNLLPFRVVADVIVPPGTTATGPGEVLLRSDDDGSHTANLGGAGYNAFRIDSIGWVNTVVLAGTTSGGSDGETTADYLDNLTDLFTIMTPRPVIPPDYEVLARRLARRMGYTARAVALDLYDPITDTYGNAKTITTVLMNVDTGEDLPGAVLTVIENTLRNLREVNFQPYVRSATRSVIDVSYAGAARPGYDPVSTNDAVEAAIATYLTAINWGSVTQAGEWENQTVIRQQNISKVMHNTPGFDHWDTLTFAIQGNPLSSDPLTLPGAIALPSAGTIVGSLEAAS